MIVHLFSGDAAADAYRAGGGKGEVIVWREALVAGPLSDEPGSLESRARYLATASGRDVAGCRQDLAAQELAITSALDVDELVLWFSRDLFCELGLLKVLTDIAGARARKATLSLVCPDDSGTAGFICFGQLPPEQVAALAADRRPLTDADLTAASAGWAALISPDPTAIDRHLANPPRPRRMTPTTATPQPIPIVPLLTTVAQDALAKQRARYPSFLSGLGRTEHAALELIAGGAGSLGEVLAGMGARLPGYGWSDLQLATELAALATGPAPLVEVAPGLPLDPSGFIDARLAITTTGLSVLRATTDRIDAVGIDTWIGAVHLTPDHLWRFDESNARLLPC